MSDKLGSPQEFDESAIGDSLTTSGGGRIIEDAAPDRLRIVSEVPRKAVRIVTGGNKVQTVAVVDKAARFLVPHEQLRARWSSVVVRPSGRVMVYDATGGMLARFEDLEQAKGEFKKAGMWDAVDKWLKAAADKRKKAEEEAKRRLAAQKAG